MSTLDLLLGMANHISTWMILGGGLSLGLYGIREARLTEHHPIKKIAEPAVSVALFPVGIMQIISLALYIFLIITGERGIANILPPELQQYGAIATVGYAASMGLSGTGNIGQIGRKVPWAVLGGGGVAVIGAGSIWHTASGLGLGTLPVLGGAAFIGIILFVAMFFITLPGQETVEVVGNAMAFGPVMVGNSVTAAVLGVFSAIGMVVL